MQSAIIVAINISKALGKTMLVVLASGKMLGITHLWALIVASCFDSSGADVYVVQRNSSHSQKTAESYSHSCGKRTLSFFFTPCGVLESGLQIHPCLYLAMSSSRISF